MFTTKNVKDISDQVHHTGKYSDYESDNSVHYFPGHNLIYYSEQKYFSIEKIKGVQRK